jgi:hypothetical protein
MESRFRQGIIFYLAQKLPPMEYVVHLLMGKTLVRQNDGQTDQVAGPRNIGAQEQQRYLENEHEEPERNAVGALQASSSDQPLHLWLYGMGLSPRALQKMVSVFGWMLLPFIGQWLFWTGFIDAAGDS